MGSQIQNYKQQSNQNNPQIQKQEEKTQLFFSQEIKEILQIQISQYQQKQLPKKQMIKSLIALTVLLNIYLCQISNSTLQIFQMFNESGVQYTYENNKINITGPNNIYINLTLKDVVIDVYFTITNNENLTIFFQEFNLQNVLIDLKDQSLFQVETIQALIFIQLQFDNVTIQTPVFNVYNCSRLDYFKGFIINSNLYQGFGTLNLITDLGIEHQLVDIYTIQNLNENFYNLNNIGIMHAVNCNYGSYQERTQNIDTTNHQIFQENKKYLSFIKLEGDNKKKFSVYSVFFNITANFDNLNIRFLLIFNSTNDLIYINYSKFMNMKSIDSGGCISNQADVILSFNNTLFDNCQSGMFGGAIFSSNLQVEDQLTIQNSKSKIGGGFFSIFFTDFKKINFANNSNTATISSQQYFICTMQPDKQKQATCNLFEIDSIYELNSELINTEYYLQKNEFVINKRDSPPHIIYTSTLYQSLIYLIRLKVEYQCHEQKLCSVREFDDNQSIGNLYNFIKDDLKKYFYNFDIPNVNYPYVLTSYFKELDCQPQFNFTFIFKFVFFKDYDNKDFIPFNSKYGCFNLTTDCQQGMQKIKNLKEQYYYCKYCDFGTYSDDSQNNCAICDTDKFDKCYANYSYLKQAMWRPNNNQYNDTYICQLNQQSSLSILMIFFFTIYILTYYFVDFDKYDSSIHSRIYSLLNPLQNQGGVSYDCFLKQYFPNSESLGYIKLLLSVISPLVVNGFFLIIIIIYSYCRKKNYFFLLISSFTYSIIFVFQSSIIQYSIESLTCIQLQSNDEYLMIDTKINCKDELWINSMKALSIPALIIYVFVIPIIIFIYIYKNRKQLEKSKVIILFGFMYDEYKREFYYWQFVKIFLTTFMSGLVTFGKTNIVLSCYIYCSVLCIYSVQIIYFKPFQQVVINKIELVSIVLSILYVTSSICLQLQFSSENKYDQYQYGRIISETYYYTIFDEQGVQYTSQNNNITIKGPDHINIYFSLKDVVIDVFFTISNNDQSLFQVETIYYLGFGQLKFDNVTSQTPVFNVYNCTDFEYFSGFIKNSYLYQGFGYFSQVRDLGVIHQMNCTYGNYQKKIQNIDSTNLQTFQDDQMFNYQNENKKYLSFIKIEGDIKNKKSDYSIFYNITANFDKMNIRFLLILNSTNDEIQIIYSQFMNMKSIESGGCISNQGDIILTFNNTLFDNCQSGMFGGAIFSSNLQILYNLTIQNCKSKIGGGFFSIFFTDFKKINFANNSNTATISSQQYFICTMQPDKQKQATCNLFEIDSIYELNSELINTEYYLQKNEFVINQRDSPPQIIYTSTLYQSLIYLIRLKVEYQCHEQKLCSVREFDDNQSIGNLYNFIKDDLKKYFYNFDIPNVNYPYVLTSYFKELDCQPQFNFTFIFKFVFFKDYDNKDFIPFNSKYGCFNLRKDCQQGMQKIKNLKEQYYYCKYCDFGTYSDDSQNNCAICDTDKFDKCYANYSYLKQAMWRPNNNQYNDTYFCQLNQQSFLSILMIFFFTIYILTYYFVDFDKYDSSIHSRIYSLLNPLQNQGGVSYDCFLKQYFPNSESLGYIKLLLSVISPLVVNGFFLIIITIYSYCRKKNYFFLLISSFTYSIIFVFQSSIIQYSIESLTCMQLSYNDEYLMIDTKINCKNESWMNSMKALSIPALIIYVFVTPIIIFIYIYKNRKQLERSKVIIVFGFMYDEYKREFYYWQFVKIFLTTFMSGLVTFGKTNIILSCYIYCSVLCIYSVSIIYFKPFQQVVINKIELVSIVLSILYVTSSICLQLQFSSDNKYDQYQYGLDACEEFQDLFLVQNLKSTQKGLKRTSRSQEQCQKLE
ncbi:hypothetical protein ABPG74_020683 [Tetrahymena malaccensis]